MVRCMTTRTHTEILGPGDNFALTANRTEDGGQEVTLHVLTPEPEPPARGPLLIGMEGPVGKETEGILSGFPGLQYMREFGSKVGTDTLPSLPSWTGGKLKVMPSTCRPHVSWKQWDVARQRAWLDARPMQPGATLPDGYWPELDSTYWHEPHGDIDPALYRQRGEAWASMLDQHPNGQGITNGPIVTRYWLCDPRGAKGNPADWWYDGADTYGIDVYEPDNRTTPMSSEELFGPALEKVYAVVPDHVEILIPEYGRRVGPGQMRADMIWEDYLYLLEQHPRVRVFSAFNSSQFPEFAFRGAGAATATDGGRGTPEGATWAAALT